MSTSNQVNRRSFIKGAVGCAAIFSALEAPAAFGSSRPPFLPMAPTAADSASLSRLDQIIFDDSCASLADAGWNISPVANPGAYITDHATTVENPMGIAFDQVPEDQYLMKATPLAGIHISTDTMQRRMTLGEGSWKVAFRLAVQDMMTPYRLPQSNGMRLWVQSGDIARGGRYFDFSFMPTGEIALIVTGGAYRTFSVPNGWDGEIHDWVISFDGAETVRVTYDDIEIAAWTYSGSSVVIPEGITFYNRTLDGVSGTNEFYFDHVTVSVTHDKKLVDDAHSWSDLWDAPPANDLVFFTDHEHTTGIVDWMSDVPDGRYFIRARQRGEGHVDMADGFAAGSGVWSLSTTMRFPQFDYRPSHQSDDVIVFGWDVVSGGSHYQVGWRPDRALVAVVHDGTHEILSTDWPDPTQFRTWRLNRRHDGVLEIYREEELLGSLPEGTATTEPNRVSITAGNAATYGAVAAWIDTITLVRGRPMIFDKGADLSEFWHDQVSTGSAAFFAEAQNPAKAGEYLASARQGDEAYIDLREPLTSDDGQWVISMTLRFPDFRISLSDAARDVIVFGWEVVTGGSAYEVGWKPNLALVARAADGSDVELVPPPTEDWTQWAETKFHTWRLGRDSLGRLIVNRDGALVGVVEDGMASSQSDRVRVKVGAGGTSGPVAAVITSASVSRGIDPVWFHPSFTPIAIHPDADSRGLDASSRVIGTDPLLVADPETSVRWTLTDTSGNEVDSGEIYAWAESCAVHAVPGRPGDFTLAMSLVRDGRELAVIARTIRVPLRTTVASAASPPSAIGPDQDLLLIDLDAVADDSWDTGTVSIDGTDTPLPYVRAVESTSPIHIGLDLPGHHVISIGVLSDSEQLNVSVGGQDYLLQPPDGDADATPYGLGEWFVSTDALPDGTITISPVADKTVAVAYVRVRRLTPAETRIATTPDEGPDGTRVVYNNDGTTDIVHRLVTDVETLKSVSVDRYRGTDAGYLSYGMGTTTMVWANSAYVGTVAENYDLTPEQLALMRAADERIMNFMLATVTDDRNPLAVVAEHGDSIGLPVLASLRMSAFYGQNVYPWYNGPRYEELYSQYKMVGIDGGTPADPASSNAMSLTFPRYRELLTNLLVEAASYAGVDGVELDFCRRPRVLGWDNDFLAAYEGEYGVNPRDEISGPGLDRLLAYRAEILTDFMRGVRQSLPGKVICARIPYGYNYELGADVETWVNEGLIDILVPSTWTKEDFWTVDETFPSIVDGSGVKLYGGIESVIHGQDTSKASEDLASAGVPRQVVSSRMTRQQYLFRAAQFYAAGYDGVYIFNNPSGDQSLGQLGDKVAVQKWRAFAYPVETVRNPIEVIS